MKRLSLYPAMAALRALHPRRSLGLLALGVAASLSTIPHPARASDLFSIGTPALVAGGGLGDGGPATASGVLPQDVLAAPDGSLYIADEQFNRVRKVSLDGTIQTVVGSGRYGYNGSGLPALESALGIAASVALGPDNTLWLVDLANRQIRFVDGDGRLRTFAVAGSPLFTSVPGAFAPNSIDVDDAGRLYVADRGTNVVWQIDPDGAGRRVAGNGTRGYAGDGGLSARGQLADPRAVAVGPDGTLWIADTGNRRVRSVKDGRLGTAAGNGTEDPWQGSAPALEAGIKPVDVAVDAAGRLFILDELGQRVVRLEADGLLTTVAEFGEGADVSALSVAPDGRVVVADRGRRVVVAVDPWSGDQQVIAGNGTLRASGDGQAAQNASLYSPSATARGPDGSLYFADRLNHLVRRIRPDGVIERVAGTGVPGIGGDGGPSPSALVNHPTSVAVSQAGQIYVADQRNHRVRRIDPDGTITTVAGTGEAGFSGDGGPAWLAALSLPASVALDEAGRLLIADSGNGRVRRVAADGTIETVAGIGSAGIGADGGTAAGTGAGPSAIGAGEGSRAFAGDGGPALQSSLLQPVDAKSDGRGGLLIVDAGAHRVYRVDESGYLWVVAGTGEAGAGADGTVASRAALNNPTGVAPDGAGGAFIADAGNHRVVHVDGSGVLRVLEADGLGTPGAVARTADGTGLLVSDVLTHRILRVPVERRLPSLSERLRVTDADFAYEALAALPLPDLLQVVYDPVSGRSYVTHGAGVELVSDTGERERFADFASRAYGAAPVTGAYGRGLVLGVPAELGRGKPLTLIEPDGSGVPLYFPLDFFFDGPGAVAAAPGGDLFLHQAGRVLRLPEERLLNIPGFPQAVGGVGVGPQGLEEFASLPNEAAQLAAADDGLLVALVSSRALVRVRDLNDDGRASGPVEQERLADLPGEPVAVAAVGGDAFVAVAGGRIYRVDDSGRVSLVAEGFAPEILSLSAGPDGSLLVLEGDGAGGRLVRLWPVVPALAVWPQVLDFGAVAVGEPAERTLVLRNEGRARLSLRAETADGQAFAGLEDPIDLAPGQALEVPVQLTAPGRGTEEAVVFWRDLARDQVLVEMPVEITGIGPAVSVQEELDFGTAWIGGTLRRYVTLTNAGELPLVIEHLGLAPVEEAPPLDAGEGSDGSGTQPDPNGEASGTGAGTDPITGATSGPETDTGPGAAQASLSRVLRATLEPFSAEIAAGEAIPPGGEIRVQVRMSPTARQSYTALLRVHSNDPDQPVHTVAVTGAGGRGELQISEVDLGTARVGQYLRQELELTNVGEVPLRIESLLTGTLQLIVTPRRLLLAPGETRVLDLVFRPDRHGVVEGAFRFITNDPVKRYWQLPFSGRGLSRLLDLGAESHAFEATPLGKTRTWKVAVTSFHTRTVRVAARIEGRQFRVLAQPRSLPPGDTGTVVVEYRPSRAGLVQGLLVLETDLAEAPRLEIPLTGRGQVATQVVVQAPDGPVALWPDEVLEIPVYVERAEALRGLVLELASAAGVSLVGFDVPANSLLRTTGGTPLTLIGVSPEGQPQVGLYLVGWYGAEGVTGDGALGTLQVRVRGFATGPVEVALGPVIVRSAGGLSETLAAPGAVQVEVELKGDFDGDGALTEADVAALVAAVGLPALGEEARFDLDGDGVIGAADVDVLLSHLEPEVRSKAVALLGKGILPDTVTLRAPYPNPFNAETVLVFDLPEAAPVDLAVYNLLGQHVRQLVRGEMGAGTHSAIWDGRDDRGQQVTSGTYFLVLSAGGEKRIRRALLLQ